MNRRGIQHNIRQGETKRGRLGQVYEEEKPSWVYMERRTKLAGCVRDSFAL